MKGCMEVWRTRITILILQQLLGRYKLKLKATGGKLGWEMHLLPQLPHLGSPGNGF